MTTVGPGRFSGSPAVLAQAVSVFLELMTAYASHTRSSDGGEVKVAESGQEGVLIWDTVVAWH